MVSLSQSQIASMRSAVNSVQLSMSCILERRASGTDDYGAPTGAWEVLFSGQCWYWERISRRLFDANFITGPNINVVTISPTLIVPADVDVEATDRVRSVTDEFGVELVTQVDIREVAHRLLDTVLILVEHR